MVLITFNYILGMRLNVTNINSILIILTKLLVIFYHKKFFSLNHILCIYTLRYLYGTLKSVHFLKGLNSQIACISVNHTRYTSAMRVSAQQG